MRKSLFVLFACYSLNAVYAQRNVDLHIDASQEQSRLIPSAVAEIAENPKSSGDYINTILKKCCSLAYEEKSILQEQGFELFYRGGPENEGKKDKFAGFIRRENDTLIVSFPGTRLDEKLIKFVTRTKEILETFKNLVSNAKSTGIKNTLKGLVSSIDKDIKILKDFISNKRVSDIDKDIQTLEALISNIRVDEIGKTLKTSATNLITDIKETLKVSATDLIADIRGIGNDKEFTDSLETEDVVVHSGFAKEVMEFYETMLEKIDSYEGIREIHFTGHSKGGGVAIMTALKFASDIDRGKINKFQDENAIKVVTFAAPCVLNPQGVRMFHNIIDPYNCICIYKNLDAVPYLPFALSVFPQKWTGGSNFYHVGVQANISKGTREMLGSAMEMVSLKSFVKKIDPGKLALSAAFQASKDMCNAHLIDNFSNDSINEIVGRISNNYKNNQNMSRNIIGRDQRPLLRSLVFWKK